MWQKQVSMVKTIKARYGQRQVDMMHVMAAGDICSAVKVE